MIRLWQVDLDIPPEVERDLGQLLSPCEWARAGRLSRPPLRRRFVAARGTLRQVLGSLTNERPKSMAIDCGPSGKPRVATGKPALNFNVSHSGELALICVTDEGEVGVDLEWVRTVSGAIAIVNRYFSGPEIDFVLDGASSGFNRRFALCWTRKEAIVKATGTGLRSDLRTFTTPFETPGTVSIEALGASGSEQWLLVDVPLGSEYVGAIAVPAHMRRGDMEISAFRPVGNTVHFDQCREIQVGPLLPTADSAVGKKVRDGSRQVSGSSRSQPGRRPCPSGT
jgi:4'-phosphopantetheinyl transferase